MILTNACLQLLIRTESPVRSVCSKKATHQEIKLIKSSAVEIRNEECEANLKEEYLNCLGLASKKKLDQKVVQNGVEESIKMNKKVQQLFSSGQSLHSQDVDINEDMCEEEKILRLLGFEWKKPKITIKKSRTSKQIRHHTMRLRHKTNQ